MKNIKIYEGRRILFSVLLVGVLLLWNQTVFGQCTCPPIGSNLVSDGGFEAQCSSPTNFFSDMTLLCATGFTWPIADHSNGIVLLGNAYSANFPSSWVINPHSGNQCYIGDGLWGTSVASNIAWNQSVNVIAGKRYKFTVWLYEQQNDNPPIALEVNGVEIGRSPVVPLQQWTAVCATWTAPSSGLFPISIRRFSFLTNSVGNNDFVLDDIEFVEVPLFEPVPQPDQSICKGNSATINSAFSGGSGNYSYLWSNGATTPQITVTPSVTTNYTVTITDNVTSCVAQDEVQVQVIDLTLELGSDVMVCITWPTKIEAFPQGGSGNYSYLWNTGSTASYINVDNSDPGLYSVTVTDNVYGCVVSDNINAAQWQCYGIKYYQNTSSLPTLSHFNIIDAGKNVDPSNPPQGNVVVLSGQNVTFHGGSLVEMAPGFSANQGSIFLANILPRCAFGTANITKTNLSYCTYKLAVDAEFGSQNYSYLWSTGATTKEITVSPSVNTTYTVHITDNCLGTDADLSYDLQVHYKGALSYFFPNLVTPNGDGSNDKWILADNGKTEYAFNAFYGKVEVYNIWGSRIWSQEITMGVNSTGFREGDLYWDPNSPHVWDGVYYASVYLANCDQNTWIANKGWIHVDRGGARMGIMNDTSSFGPSPGHVSNLLEIAPNPSSGIFNYYTNMSDNEILEIKVLNIYGGLVLSQSQQTINSFKDGKLDLSSYPEGIYIIQYKTKRGDGAKKIILEKN